VVGIYSPFDEVYRQETVRALLKKSSAKIGYRMFQDGKMKFSPLNRLLRSGVAGMAFWPERMHHYHASILSLCQADDQRFNEP